MSSKYIVDGMPLDVYCKDHNLNFRTQSNRVRDYIKKYPELSEHDAIMLAISKCGVHFHGTKFWYGDISLAEYCREKNKNYDCMISRVENIKEQFPDIDDNEAVRIAIEDYGDKGIKYFYDGVPLVEYCQLHSEYSYSSVLTYIRRKKEKNSDLNIQEIIDSYFKIVHRQHTYHFIDGVPLMEYCDNHDIVYTSVISILSKMRNNAKYNHLNEQERLNIVLTNYKRPYLFWNGETLASYCRKNNYSYNSVYNYIMQLMKNSPTVSYKEAVESAFASIKRYGIKYYYKGFPLVQYCKEHDLREDYVRNKILYLLSSNMILENAIEEAVNYYERKNRLNNINKIFDYLKKSKDVDPEILKQILIYLNIDYQNVLSLIDKFSSILDIVYFIWYFHDNNFDGLMNVSEVKIKEIFSSISFLSSATIDENSILQMDLGYLIGMYKANLFDTRYLIVLHQEKFHYHTLLGLMDYYGLNLNQEDKADIIKDSNLYLLELIEKNNNNNIAMVISYLTKSIKGFIFDRVLDFIKQQSNVSIYSPVYKNKSSKSEMKLIDKIMDKKYDNPLSDEVQEVICSLDSISQSFIYYKYYECLSNQEISNILNIDLDELDIFEKSILEKLSENESLKKLVKKVNTIIN